MIGCFLVCSTSRGRAKCRSVVGKISIDCQICARCLIFAVRNFKRRGWLLIGARYVGFMGVFEGKTNSRQRKTLSSSDFRPPNSKTNNKKKKKKKKTTRFQTKKKHFAKTEYLMVNLAGQTTLVVHNTTVFFLAQSTPSTCQSFDGVLCNVIQYVLFKTENLRTLWTLVFFFFHAFHHQAFSFLFTSLLAIYSLFVSTRLSFIVAMQLYLPFRQKRKNLQKGLGCLIVRMVGQPEWYG